MIISSFVVKMRWLPALLVINCAGPIGTDFDEQPPAELTNLTQEEKVTPEPTLSAQQAFREHVWPELQKSCGSCHADSQTPFFASPNIEIARQTIIDGGKVDFTDVSASRLVLRLSKDNHNCPTDCQDDAQRFVEVLTLWKKNTSVQQIDGLKTNDLDPADRSLNYDLNNLEIDARLLADVEPLPKGHGYVLRNLRLETDEKLFVNTIKPLINGRWNALNTAFLQLSCTPKTGQLQGRAATTIVADNLKSVNKLSFVFKELRLATDDDPNCRDDNPSTPSQPNNPQQPSEPTPSNPKQQNFLTDIRPIMIDSCQGSNCHTTTRRGYLFNYQQTWQRRTTIDQRITSNDANLQMPPPNSNYQLSDTDRNTLLDWLTD